MQPQRNAKLVRTIRQAIKDLGLKEYEYRGIYKRVTGKENISEKDGQEGMDNKELGRIIEALKKEGFDPAKYTRDAKRCERPQAKKIRSLWLELQNMGELRDSSEDALLSFVKKRTGESMDSADEVQLQGLIEQLKQWVDRVHMQRIAAEPAQSM